MSNGVSCFATSVKTSAGRLARPMLALVRASVDDEAGGGEGGGEREREDDGGRGRSSDSGRRLTL